MSAAPKCPIHGTPMKQWPEGYKCGAVVNEGPPKKYCNQRAPLENAATSTAVATTAAAPARAMTARVDAYPDWVRAELAPYLADPNVKLLMPAIPLNAPKPQGYRLSLSMVFIDPNPAAKDVWPVPGGGLSLSKTGLNKIADACGILLDSWKVDDGHDPEYVAYKAVGVMRTSSGEMRREPGTKGLRMSKVRARAMSNARKKNPNLTDPQLAAMVENEMAEYEMHLDARCETGAKLRAIRALVPLAGRSGLQAADLGTFLLARLDPDLSDPVMRKHVVEQGERATLALFGKQSKAEARDLGDVVEDDDTFDEALPQEPINLGNAPVEDWTDPDEPQFRKDIAEAAEVLNWTPEMAQTLIAKHNGNIANARKEIVGYVDRMGVK